MDGVSMVYTFDDANAPERRTTQYFEMFGNRAIYHDGWVAATRHSIPWLMVPNLPHVRPRTGGSCTTSTRTSARPTTSPPQNPAEAQGAAGALRRRRRSRTTSTRSTTAGRSASTPRIAGRPDLMGPRTSLTLYEGMTGITENAFINIKGRSYTVTAEIDVPAAAPNGVIIAQADASAAGACT